MSINRAERRGETGVEPSAASIGDSRGAALTESAIGLFETESIRRRGPRGGLDDVAFATLERVDRFSGRRLPEPTADIPPAEAGPRHHARNGHAAVATRPRPTRFRENRDDSLPCALMPAIGGVAAGLQRRVLPVDTP